MIFIEWEKINNDKEWNQINLLRKIRRNIWFQILSMLCCWIFFHFSFSFPLSLRLMTKHAFLLCDLRTNFKWSNIFTEQNKRKFHLSSSLLDSFYFPPYFLHCSFSFEKRSFSLENSREKRRTIDFLCFSANDKANNKKNQLKWKRFVLVILLYQNNPQEQQFFSVNLLNLMDNKCKSLFLMQELID